MSLSSGRWEKIGGHWPGQDGERDEMRTIETGLDKRARQSAQHRPGLRRQVVPARHLVLLLPLLLMLALREINYVSCS
jgi:hypothetical protein